MGLPWLYFKRRIRCGNAEDMDSFYGMALDVFRAVGKVHYAILVVDYFLVICGLTAAVLAMWKSNRTYSRLGNPGRDGALDHAEEGQNNDVKELGPSSPENIDTKIWVSNGLRAMDNPARKMLGVERYKNNDYSRVKQEHVDRIVRKFKEKLGASMDDLFGPNRKKSNPFGGTKCPWKDVKNQASSRRNYIQAHFENHASPFTD